MIIMTIIKLVIGSWSDVDQHKSRQGKMERGKVKKKKTFVVESPIFFPSLALSFLWSPLRECLPQAGYHRIGKISTIN